MKKYLTEKFPADLIAKLLLSLAFVVSGFQHSIFADQNNTAFIVAGGDFNSPFYNLTFESNGSTVDFQNYPLRKGNKYFFKAGNISSSHPFNIGSSHNVNLSKCNRRSTRPKFRTE